MRIVWVVLALLISAGGFVGISSGHAAAAVLPGPCHDIEVTALQGSIMIKGTVPDNYESADVRGVHIYRGTDPDSLTLLYTLKVYTNTARFFLYQDTGVSNGVTYYYSVAAFNTLGEGDRSEVFSSISLGPPPAPQGLTASVTCSYVHLQWSPPISDGGQPLMHYSVFRGLRGSEPTIVANTTGLSFDDVNVAFNDSYYNYEVCAVNEYGAGKRSLTVFASLPMPVVSGQLVWANGTAVAGATVAVDSNGTVASTDPNGSFSIAITPGVHTLAVYVNGTLMYTLNVTVLAGPQDLGVITIGENEAAAIGLDTIFLVAVIAVVTAGMLIWATGKAR
ncbi:MAG: hypothetical protein SA339_03205 [Methanomassiliicoccus sp.]|nr:hypothetical protein [Methanomassiliicoccus sp.]